MKTTFKFDGDYDNLEQVAEFYQEFKKIKDSIDGHAYNSLFEGKIAGLAGENESKGIYLLQQLDTANKRSGKINGLLKDGYKQVVPEDGGSTKYESVVKVGNDYSQAGVDEYPKARIVFAEKRMFIVPKGNRTRGYNVWPESLVFVK